MRGVRRRASIAQTGERVNSGLLAAPAHDAGIRPIGFEIVPWAIALTFRIGGADIIGLAVPRVSPGFDSARIVVAADALAASGTRAAQNPKDTY